jgi:hypothetical protein
VWVALWTDGRSARRILEKHQRSDRLLKEKRERSDRLLKDEREPSAAQIKEERRLPGNASTWRTPMRCRQSQPR